MKALITGAQGFVGPYLQKHLKSCGDSVTALDRDNGPDLLEPQKWIEYIANDIPEVIYHLAGWSNVGSSWESPQECFQINANGTLTVLNAARLNNVKRVIVVSSADVYKDVKQRALSETDELRPSSPYGMSKYAAEIIANQFFSGYDIDVVIARPFNHIGPGQSSAFVASKFAEEIAKLEQSNSEVFKHGNLNAARDFTDVRDVVRSYRLLAELGEPGETYNICSGNPITIQNLLKNLLSYSKVEIKTEVDQSLIRPVDCELRYGTPEKIHKQTGWKPEHKIEETLAEILDEKRRLF